MARKKGIPLDLIIELHNQGLYDQEIADMLGCRRSNITKRLLKAGYQRGHSKINDLRARNKISQTLIGRFVGENNPNYKGGSEIKTLARGIFKTFSKRKMREVNFTCQNCGRRGGDLAVHHIKPFHIILNEFLEKTYDGNIDTLYEQLMKYSDFIDENNLVCLCEDCHKKLHYSDNPELSPYRWESATTIENSESSEKVEYPISD